VKAGAPDQIVFQSDPAPTRGLFTSPDATASLFDSVRNCFLAPMSASGGPGRGPSVPADFRCGANEILSRKTIPCGKAAMA